MRDIKQCHPKLQQLADNLLRECSRQGLKIKITECLRTVAEQDALYAQGRTKSGNIVTYARGSSYSSMHQWGVAFDFCRNDGKGAYNDADGFFTKVGKMGKKLGLEWGGDWSSPVDKPHFQLPQWGSTTTKLKQTYGTPDKFFKTWATVAKATVATAKKEEKEVVEKSKIIVEGKEIPVSRILKDGTNYIKLRDIADACGYTVGNKGNIAVLTKK